jgi:hypothetical protein
MPAGSFISYRRGRKAWWIGGAVVVGVLGAISSMFEESSPSMPIQPPAQVLLLLPSGYGMQHCGCWGPNPAPLVPEPRCASGQVQLGTRPGTRKPSGVPYGYRCL